MTKRHKKLIADRLYKINEIVNIAKKDPEKTARILKDYRVEDDYESTERICGYMPDILLDEIIEDLDMAIGALEGNNVFLQITYDEDQLKELVEEAKENLQKPAWIPVTEAEPEEYGEFLITWTTGRSTGRDNQKEKLIGFAEYEITVEKDEAGLLTGEFKGEWIMEEHTKNYPKPEVIAWMPIPDKYEEVRSR